MTDKIDLSVIIPVYNEAATCAEIIKRVQAISVVYEIIVVDDAVSYTHLKLPTNREV